MRILVLDVGTSSMRGTVMDDRGSTLSVEQIKYHPVFSGSNQVTQDPNTWVEAMTQLCQKAAAAGDVDAVAITSQRSSVIPLDADGKPLCDAIMWQDSRNRSICDGLEEYQKLVHERCGVGINTVFSGGKMLWFRLNRPDLYCQLKRYVVIPDYLICHMTGEYVTDHTYGSRSMLMDLRKCQWDDRLLDLFKVEKDQLCRLIPPSSIAGHITADFAAISGLTAGIPVITCGGDQQCATLGQGVIRPGVISINLGTGAYLSAAAKQVPEQLSEDVLCNVSAIPGQYVLESSILTCGAALDWLLGLLGKAEASSAVAEALNESPRGGNGLVVLPRFQGAIGAKTNGIRGIFAGLSLSTTKQDLIRALLEGICCEIRFRIGQMQGDSTVDLVCASGGLTRSPQVCQLLADILGLEVVVQDDGDATTRGAWMSAACCLGIVPNWDDAWKIVDRQSKRSFSPDPQAVEFYESLMQKQHHLFCATENI